VCMVENQCSNGDPGVIGPLYSSLNLRRVMCYYITPRDREQWADTKRFLAMIKGVAYGSFVLAQAHVEVEERYNVPFPPRPFRFLSPICEASHHTYSPSGKEVEVDVGLLDAYDAHPTKVTFLANVASLFSRTTLRSVEGEVCRLWERLERRPELDVSSIYRFLVKVLSGVCLKVERNLVETARVVEGSCGPAPHYYYTSGIYVPLYYWAWYGRLELTTMPWQELHPLREGISLRFASSEKGYLYWIEHMVRYLPDGIFRVVKTLFNSRRIHYRSAFLSSIFAIDHSCEHNSGKCFCFLYFKGGRCTVFEGLDQRLSFRYFDRDFHRFACFLAENWTYDAGLFVINGIRDCEMLERNVRSPLRSNKKITLPPLFYGPYARAPSCRMEEDSLEETEVEGETILYMEGVH